MHAGVVPQWTVETTLALAREVESALRNDPRNLFDHMYGDEPDRWSADLAGTDRLRFAINVLTRMRVCTSRGPHQLAPQGQAARATARSGCPGSTSRAVARATMRVVFGHWSALGLVVRDDVIGLDSGCVWGGALTAFDLDAAAAGAGAPISVSCAGYQSPDE